MQIEINSGLVKEIKKYCKKKGIILDNKHGMEQIVNGWLQEHLDKKLDDIAIRSKEGEVETIEEENIYNSDEDDIKELNFNY